MDRFAAMAVFAKVVEKGSFAGAAERLSLSTSSVSRQVAELEQHLGVRLLNRTTRTLSLTESGQAYLERVLQLLADLEEAEAAVSVAAVEPRGTLRLTAPITFGEGYLAPAIAAFAARHERLRFDVELSDRMVDIVDEGFDLAVRIGEPGGQALIARRLAAVQLVCCASPGYLARHGTPRTPDDLARHRCVTYSYVPVRDAWRFQGPDGREHVAKVSGPLQSNHGGFLAQFAAQDGGILLEPDFVVHDALAEGRLVALLPGFVARVSSVYAVYPSRRHLSAKVRAFVDFLAARFAADTPWRLPAAGKPAPGRRRPGRAGRG